MRTRNTLAILVSTVSALIVFASRFFKVPALDTASQSVLEWTTVVAAFALGLGAVNLVRVHSKNVIQRRDKNWWLSIVALIFFAVPTVMGIALSPNHEAYRWAYDTFYVPLNASIVGLGVFWLCSASYRAFRVRNIHAILLLVSAITIMIGSMGLGKVYLPFSTVASEWLNSVISSAVMRAMGMITAIGMVGVGLRIVLGLERRTISGGGAGE
jgi:uncharacterized membrane protein